MKGRHQPKTLRGQATETIQFGQHVLCRGGDCTPAQPQIANGVARPLPSWSRTKHYEAGDFVLADAILEVGQRDVHALAQLPIMDPIHLNLPAGKLDEAAYQERLNLQFREAGIDRKGKRK